MPKQEKDTAVNPIDFFTNRLFDLDNPLNYSSERDDIFVKAIRESFIHHHKNSEFYRFITQRRGGFHADEIKKIEDVHKIPWIFVNAFKLYEFLSVPPSEIEISLTSSGTTANTKSRNSWDAGSMSRLNRSVQAIGEHLGINNTDSNPDYLIFGYDPSKAGDLGTAWSDGNIQQLAPARHIQYALKKKGRKSDWQFDLKSCVKFLKSHAESRYPVRIIGFPAFLWETLNQCRKEGLNIKQHPESVIILGGGWKSHAGKEIPREHFFAETGFHLGLDRARMVDIYGLVEHGIPYMTCSSGNFHVPVYCRAFTRDPGSLKPLPYGKTGLLHLISPYLTSVPALSLLTSDKAIVHEKCSCELNSPIIELCGRGGVKKHKGCAVKAAELLGKPEKSGDISEIKQDVSENKESIILEDNSLSHPLERSICINGRMSRNKKQLTPEKAAKIMKSVRNSHAQVSKVSLDDVLETLDTVSRRWANPGYRHRLEALSIIPDKIGFSKEMVEEGINVVSAMCSRESLLKTIDIELGDTGLYGGREFLDGFVWQPERNHYVSARPAGCVLHVTAGNVFVGAIASLIPGLLARCSNIMKLSSVDPIFPLLFVKSLTECGPAGTRTASLISMLQWKGGDKKVEEVLKKHSDRILVFGGKNAVEAYLKDLPAGVAMIEHGPKFGIAAIGKDSPETLEELADKAALDVLMWDQQACSSPHIYYIEEGSNNRCAEFAELLADSMKKKGLILPPGEQGIDEQIEILRVREEYEARTFHNDGFCINADNGGLVLRDKSTEFEPSPGSRMIFVKPVTDLESLPEMLTPKGYFLQTVGLAASEGRLIKIAEAFADAGATRITTIGGMSQGLEGAPHDAGYPLREMLRFVDIEKNPPGRPAFDYLKSEQIKEITERRLNQIASYARTHSPFWRKRLAVWNKTRNFEDIPLTSKEEVHRRVPPVSTQMLTSNNISGAYVFGSGGTKGAHKIFMFTPRELERSTYVFGDGFLAAGMRKNDVIANMFMPGNLWTSFLVVNKALERVGCTILPLGGNADPAMAVPVMKDFKCTVICGIPTYLGALARYALSKKINIKIRTIAYAGEHMHKELRQLLTKAFSPENIVSLGYAAVDAGPIGYQCESSTGTIHHAASEYMHVEILDQFGNAVEDGEVGEIVITNLHRSLQPVIRYRVGDLARKIASPCDCGRNSIRFELLGRSDDVIIVSGTNIPMSMVQSSLETVPGFTGEFKIQMKSEADGRDIMTLSVELKSDSKTYDIEVVSQMIRKALLDNCSDLASDLDSETAVLDILILSPGTLEGISRTGKAVRFQDLRKM